MTPIHLLLVAGLMLLLGALQVGWGASRRRSAAAQGSERLGGFGGPPGTSDIGTADGFGVTEPGTDQLGETLRLTGLTLVGIAVAVAVAALIWWIVR